MTTHLAAICRGAAALAIAGVLLSATSAMPARADDRHDDRRGGDHRGHERDDRGAGGYYPAPPVVYAAPAYYPPPVVYGPAVGIVLPGVSIGIR